MYLKSLTLRGFKSFASTTTLAFEPGITCVVGPNGSGKSNVVDALSWVMGEQGAKTLRGGKMEDVIFAGTAGRAPLGRAEVILTIDNTDGALPIDYAEVTIARTMFRSGGSEYAINGTAARLLDVQELLSDSGIGREMHVIVGQGQLDSILQATPEVRRGFIEEAAGVLKHRKRKEKALRKLEATEANLNRLSDLVIEIRRQLKPLGRQAEVARKAQVVQAELRDAKARLMADDLVQATLTLESERAVEATLRSRRAELEAALDAARNDDAVAEQASRAALPRVTAAQETWYALAGLAERVNSTASIAQERLRHAREATLEDRPGRDPEAIERELAEVRVAKAALDEQVSAAAAALEAATSVRAGAEAAQGEADRRYAAQQRAIADRREGLARLTGEVHALRSRAEAAQAEMDRLDQARLDALGRSADANRRFAALESTISKLSAGEHGLDAAYEAAEAALAAIDERVAELTAAEHQAHQQRAAVTARVEALRLGLERKDGSSALLAADVPVSGLLGHLAALVTVRPGYETAISAALGAVAEAVAVADVDAALGAFDVLKEADLGRAALVLGAAAVRDDRSEWPALSRDAVYAIDLVTSADELRSALARALHKVAVVSTLDDARALVATTPDVTAVTRDGDVLSAWFATGGSGSRPSPIEIQAAVDDAERRLAGVQADLERTRFALAEQGALRSTAQAAADAALARLHESDAEQAALAEELAHLRQVARAAIAEADRAAEAHQRAGASRERTVTTLADVDVRLAAASETSDQAEADPAERDHLTDLARQAVAAEMDARLALRTLQERARALDARAEALARTANAERAAQESARLRREQAQREIVTSAAVSAAAAWLSERVAQSQALAAAERSAAEQNRVAAEQELAVARARSRDLAREFESLVDAVHADELTRAQHQMRLENLAAAALAELGLDAATLMDEYGPDHLIPVPDGDPVPFVRVDQEKRLRAAERDLATLGKINPLALEEFDALGERHQFLSEQLEDLRKTRADLSTIIEDVDRRVEDVFAAAYADVEVAFRHSFARLFPGGEGRLVLTEPGSWLTTGVDVEARPAGKKVKRLSLLSGGERSLVAVAFLVALFKARPSPFYILDEVEAALDDVNLGRLLGIYEELRATSQMLIITHQKRTMEIADALYGVTMRSDGVSTVISQRLRDG